MPNDTQNVASTTDAARPDNATLGRWLRSWVQPNGAIHGFHNHSVWGGNPFRYGDATCGHSTFASPLLPGLALALKNRPDARGQELLERLVRFQTGSFQPDGQFAHIGFQIGETLKSGLIHNMTPCIALCETVRVQGEAAPVALRQSVDEAVRRNLAVCATIYGDHAQKGSVANQEYARQWARLAHMKAFGHAEWDDAVRRDLDFLVAHFHVNGLPDDESSGTLRVLSDATFLEPAEYYGLMIWPLLLAFERFGEPQYRAMALALARHVARSSWRDANGQRRFHRLWQRIDGQWHNIHEPMLIGGMGLTLSSLQALHPHEDNDELAHFLAETDATYAYYQSGAGFFLSASGWDVEPDIIPASAWQSHDFFHLASRHDVGEGFWDTVFASDPRVAAVFGPSMIWLETATHWALHGYHTGNGLELVGRKDSARFYVDIPAWIGSGREAPPDFLMPDRPIFARLNDRIVRLQGRSDIVALNDTQRTWSG